MLRLLTVRYFMLTDQDPLTTTKPALDKVVLLYILYQLPSGSPARIIWDIHRQVSLVTFVPLSMLMYLGYPQCCVTIPLTSSSSFSSCLYLAVAATLCAPHKHLQQQRHE